MPSGHNIRLQLRKQDVYLGCGILFFLGLFTHLFQSTEGVPNSGVLKSLFLPVALLFQAYALFLLTTKKYLPQAIKLFKTNVFFPLALIYILLSVIWSIDKAETFRRSIALIGTTAFGILLGLHYTNKKLINLFKISYLIIVVSSVLLAVFIPNYGTHLHGEFIGFWRGTLSFKNQMGWAVAIFLILWSSELNLKKVFEIPFAIGMFLGLLLLFNTHSSTGLIVFIAGLLVLLIINAINRFNFFRPIFIIFFIILAFIGITYFNLIFEYILNLVGKDASLTGRTSIWLELMPTIKENSILGVGYSAFWPNALQYFGSFWMSELNHAHNTYIELVVDLGFVGLLLCMSFLLSAYKNLFQNMMNRQPGANTIFTLWTMIFIIGFSGKVVFVPNSGLWILMVAFFVSSNRSKLNKGYL